MTDDPVTCEKSMKQGSTGVQTAAPKAAASLLSIVRPISEVKTALSTFRSLSSALSHKSGVITTRQKLTSEMASVLEIGDDTLANAEMNRESADLLPLQTSPDVSRQASISVTICESDSTGIVVSPSGRRL